MTLNIESARPLRRRDALRDLVRAVRDAQPSEQETHSLEWKSGLDLTARSAAAVIAKAVIGFANRDPERAAQSFEGCAYLIVGAEPGSVAGVAQVDMAKLDGRVSVYTGDGPEWRGEYVDVDGQDVLVVTVEAPRWGDSIHCTQKAYLPQQRSEADVPLGTIFVRHLASTERATPADIEMLTKRAAHQPGTYLDVSVELVADTAAVRIDNSEDAVLAYARRECRLLLASRDGPTMPGQSSPMFSPGVRIDYRSPAVFSQQVATYEDQLIAWLPKALIARAVEHGLGEVRFELVNRTDLTFRSVRVELRMPLGIAVYGWQHDADEDEEEPERPLAFGQRPDPNLVGGRTRLIGMPVVRPAWIPRVIVHGDETHVTFEPDDSRASGRSYVGRLWIVANEDGPDPIEISWEATAHEALKRVTGRLALPIKNGAVGPDALMRPIAIA